MEGGIRQVVKLRGLRFSLALILESAILFPGWLLEKSQLDTQDKIGEGSRQVTRLCNVM